MGVAYSPIAPLRTFTYTATGETYGQSSREGEGGGWGRREGEVKVREASYLHENGFFASILPLDAAQNIEFTLSAMQACVHDGLSESAQEAKGAYRGEQRLLHSW